MEKKQIFFLRSDQVKSNCLNFINSLPTDDENPLVIEIKPITRTLKQNNKLHGMFSDISKQAVWQDDTYDLNGWKNLLVSGHAIATNLPYKLVTGIEGELVNVREQTSKMSVGRMNSLIEYTTAWGVSNGVHFNDRYDFWGR